MNTRVKVSLGVLASSLLIGGGIAALTPPAKGEYSPAAISNTLDNHEKRIQTLETPTPSPEVITNTVYTPESNGAGITNPPTPQATPVPTQAPGDAAKSATPEPNPPQNRCIILDHNAPDGYRPCDPSPTPQP
jgi:hypothetical protein